jgi:hypothetical protein
LKQQIISSTHEHEGQQDTHCSAHSIWTISTIQSAHLSTILLAEENPNRKKCNVVISYNKKLQTGYKHKTAFVKDGTLCNCVYRCGVTTYIHGGPNI